MKQLETYSKNFNAYLLNPDQTKPRGARIAPSGRVQDLVNTGLVKNHANDKGGAENLWTVTDANGVTRPKSQAELNAEQKLRAEQAGNLFQTKKLSSPADPTVSRKKRTNGNIETFGRRLPQNFFFSNSFGRHIRDFARLFEEAMDNGETLNTSYFAVLTKSSDTGAVRDKDLGNAVRIDREVMPFEWFVSSQKTIPSHRLWALARVDGNHRVDHPAQRGVSGGVVLRTCFLLYLDGVSRFTPCL